jgi:hypothetical protein
MAGGDIAPVEPVVEAPAEVSSWDFSGTAKLYYQTVGTGTVDLFDQLGAAANAGIQLRATNSDVIAGIGAGFELSGLATLDLEKDVVATPMQLPSMDLLGNPALTGGWISQAYLTYGFGNTTFKFGRQELPKSLSPFAFSEKWNVFANTYDAALLVNTDLPDTTAVLAYVSRANTNEQFLFAGANPLVGSFGASPAMNDFSDLGGVWMLTLQNKSIENVTLTGSYYNSTDLLALDVDVDAWWIDAQIAAGDFTVGLQGGNMDIEGVEDATGYGAKIATAFSGVDVALAYSKTDDGHIINIGGTTSALYTNTVGNQLLGQPIDEDKFVVSAGAEALGGNIHAAFATSDSDVSGDFNELDLVYSTNVTDDLNIMAAYVMVDPDGADQIDVIRVVGTYNF